MRWPAAEAFLTSYIQTQWALTVYAATMPLVFENDNQAIYSHTYMAVSIEGILSEKTIFGGPGARSSVEVGMVFYHAFQEAGTGKTAVVGAVDAMTEILELKTLNSQIKLEGANPPSPVATFSSYDREIPRAQPGGNYYRCSGSTPFIVLDNR
jgi:hypothetical protein